MRMLIIVAGLAALSPTIAFADQEPPAANKTVALEELLEAVSKKSGDKFLQHANVRPEVVIGPMRAKDISMDSLHTVLRNNELAAVRVESTVNIIPVALVRQHPLRRIEANDESIPADEWVIRTISPERAWANHLVPLLRPMVPQAGHLVAHGEASVLVIVAPYEVSAQLKALVDEIDAATPEREE